jgi:hypothetical protein
MGSMASPGGDWPDRLRHAKQDCLMWSILSIISKLLSLFYGIMSWLKLRAAKQEGRNEQELESTKAAESDEAKAKSAADNVVGPNSLREPDEFTITKK